MSEADTATAAPTETNSNTAPSTSPTTTTLEVNSPPLAFSALSVDAQLADLNTRLTAATAEIEALKSAPVASPDGDQIAAAAAGIARLNHHIFGE